MAELAEGVEGGMGVAATAAARFGAVEDVVLARLDGFRGEDAFEFVATRVLIGPHSYCLEHVTLNFDIFAAQGWVVEGPDDVVDDLIYGDIGVFPGKDDATEVV